MPCHTHRRPRKAMSDTAQIIERAHAAGLAVPAFNIPYLPMIEPVVRALVDQDAFALDRDRAAGVDQVRGQGARGGAGGVPEVGAARPHPAAPRPRAGDRRGRAAGGLPGRSSARRSALGYGSVMVDGSRLTLAGEHRGHARRWPSWRTRRACRARRSWAPSWATRPARCRPTRSCSRRGAASPTWTRRCASCARPAATGSRWPSATSTARSPARCSDQKKVEARLNLEHLARLREATGIPLVLHGGSGVQRSTCGRRSSRDRQSQRRHRDPPGLRGRAARERPGGPRRSRPSTSAPPGCSRDYYGLTGTRKTVVGPE